MEANEMADRLLLEIDRMASSTSPGYEPAELSMILTKAMNYYVKSTLSPLTNAKREGIEESEVRNQGFSALIKTSTLTPSANTATNLANGVFVDLPEDFMLAILEEATISAVDCHNENLKVEVLVISHNEYNRTRKNPYRKPYASKENGLVWRLQVGRTVTGELPSAAQTPKRHELLTDDSFTVSSYFLRYVMVPPEIVVDFDNTANQRHCILDESTHFAILDIASKMLRTAVDRQLVPNMPTVDAIE